MPELPEVEVTRRGFADRIAGAEISGVHVGKPLRWPLGCDPDSLVGRHVKGVRRRGKYLLIDLDRGLLLVHLGMSGSLAFDRQLGPAGPHDHFDLQTNQGTLRLHDPRRFGAVVRCAHEGDGWGQKLLGKLGPEPFGPVFTESGFLTGLRQRQSPVKQVLLGGELVVGVGNIYASEALFRAGIRPTVRASRVSRSAAVRLYQAVKAVLAEAVSKRRYEQVRSLNVLLPGTLSPVATATYFYNERGSNPVEGMEWYVDSSLELTWRGPARTQVGIKGEAFNLTNREAQTQSNNTAFCGTTATAACTTAVNNFGKANARGAFQQPRRYRVSAIFRF